MRLTTFLVTKALLIGTNSAMKPVKVNAIKQVPSGPMHRCPAPNPGNPLKKSITIDFTSNACEEMDTENMIPSFVQADRNEENEDQHRVINDVFRFGKPFADCAPGLPSNTRF